MWFKGCLIPSKQCFGGQLRKRGLGSHWPTEMLVNGKCWKVWVQHFISITGCFTVHKYALALLGGSFYSPIWQISSVVPWLALANETWAKCWEPISVLTATARFSRSSVPSGMIASTVLRAGCNAAVVPRGEYKQQSCNQTSIHIKHERCRFWGLKHLDLFRCHRTMWSACLMEGIYLNLLIDMRTVDPQWERESVNTRALLLQQLPALFWVHVPMASLPGEMPAA